MHERQRRAADQLRTDRDVVSRAASVVRAAPEQSPPLRLAGLDQPRTAALLAELLDALAGRLDAVPGSVREHVVRVARETTGDPMDRPGVRRTRR